MSESKQIEQFIKAFKNQSFDQSDEFKMEVISPAIEQFESMNRLEKKMETYFTNKRIDISEKMCFDKKSINANMRVFFDSEVVDDGSDYVYLKLNIFGRLVLNEKEDLTNGEYFSQYRNSSVFERNLVKNFTFCENVKDLEVHFDNMDMKGTYFGSEEKLKKGQLKPDQIDGFTVIRSIRADMITFPLKCSISLAFETNSQLYKLSRELKEFMGLEHATRRQITDKIYEYVKKHALLEENKIKLDNVLSNLFKTEIEASNNGKIPLSDISPMIRSLLGESESFQFEYFIQQDAVLKKYMEVYDLKIQVPLEIAPDIIKFYVSKLIFNEEEKKKLISDDYVYSLNVAIRNHEKMSQLQDQINKKFWNLKEMMARREILKKISENSTRYFGNFITNWEKNKEFQEKQNPVFLGKRGLLEENEFADLLQHKYEDLLDKEIDNFLRNKLHH